MLWSVGGGRQGGNGRSSCGSEALSGSCKRRSGIASLAGSERGGAGHTGRLANSKASHNLGQAQEEGGVVGPQLQRERESYAGRHIRRSLNCRLDLVSFHAWQIFVGHRSLSRLFQRSKEPLMGVGPTKRRGSGVWSQDPMPFAARRVAASTTINGGTSAALRREITRAWRRGHTSGPGGDPGLVASSRGSETWIDTGKHVVGMVKPSTRSGAAYRGTPSGT